MRQDLSASGALGGLIDELYQQHVRVALGKVSPLGARDPFCFSEDEGVLRLLRRDESFWTSARFGVINHLLWTLGLLDGPDDEDTSLGRGPRTEVCRCSTYLRMVGRARRW